MENNENEVVLTDKQLLMSRLTGMALIGISIFLFYKVYIMNKK